MGSNLGRESELNLPIAITGEPSLQAGHFPSSKKGEENFIQKWPLQFEVKTRFLALENSLFFIGETYAVKRRYSRYNFLSYVYFKKFDFKV